MKKRSVNSPSAPPPLGPYSQAVAVGPWLFLSGQIPLVPETGKIIKGDIALQTERVMRNIEAVLKANNMDFGHIVKAGIFLKNMEDFSSVNKVYSRFFTKPFPARSCVAVQDLPKGVDMEIEMLAYLS